jgi:hypothetical protein
MPDASPPSGARATFPCGVAVVTMALQHDGNEPLFKISKGLAQEISDGFGFSLAAKEILELEGASRENIEWRRLIGRRKGSKSNHEGRAATERRRMRTAKIISKLLSELEADAG